ncbi:NCS1 family nucleobase:cation symporter-1 [Komagataeibacter swingsii]|uniref:NCS1 family nucleobase:cation symporter-1 n=1 Tax=Komagataeibacter swingsii TaxID=215220 RepID=A0A850P866_9PROT|nr:NCS1 family nucleobase:cation symporter-1 [Komagataeibacter swingsii]NVN38052.1 NCS1 family nucleobase:cation symporter-1 [Komagataeibacter swingsii]
MHDGAGTPDTHLTNADLAPTGARTWGWFDYVSLWMSNIHSVGGYVTMGSLFAMGLPATDVFMALIAAIVVIQVLCNLVARPSQISGAPYPVMARMAFGVHGALVPAFIRGIISIAWYGIQTWLASNAVVVLLLRQWPELTPWAQVGIHGFAGLSMLGWAAFIMLWIMQALVFWRGMDMIRHFVDWAGPIIYVVMIGLDAWLLSRAGWQHFSFDIPGVTYHTIPARIIGMMNAIALVTSYFAPIALNFGDFSRYGVSMSAIRRGNLWGLPVNFMGFSLLTLVTIVLTQPVFGRIILDPVETVAQIDSPLAVIVGVLTFVMATAGINIAANFVSAAFDFSNLAPHRISWRSGGMVAAAGAVIMTPWNLYARPELIHLTLDVLATFIGPLIAILLTDYYIVRRGMIDMNALYRSQSNLPYWYHNGINPIAILVTLVAVIVGSAVVFMPALEPIHNLSLFIGGGIAAILYGILMRRYSARLTASANRRLSPAVP